MKLNPTPALRRRLYEVAIAGCALATGYGLLTAEQSLLWLGLAGAVLGVARVNVSPGPRDGRD